MNEKNEFDLKLDQKLSELQACQEKNNKKSCSLCDEFLKCTLRQSYVHSVYSSMSKGQAGDFDFN